MNEANLAITLMFEGIGLEDEQAARVLDRLMDAFPVGDPDRPQMFQMALSRRPLGDLEEQIAQWATNGSEMEDDMALTKHGEGSVIPETEAQKTATRDGGGMSAEAAEELARENERADDPDVE